MIELTGLFKTYKDGEQSIKAVDGVSLNINTGDYVTIVGHSGSGKTTLLSLIGGLTKPDQGSVVIDGLDIWTMNDDALSTYRNKNVNFIFQFASLIPTLTVLDNVLLPTAFGDGANTGVVEYAKSLLEMVGLSDKMNSFPSRLSGGQQRRVAIARAFINKPKILLADEPTGDLDEATEADIMEVFRKQNQSGTTFVIVTHNRALANTAKKRYSMAAGVLSELS